MKIERNDKRLDHRAMLYKIGVEDGWQRALLPTERWFRDPHNHDLWHGAHGLIVNTAALKARTSYVSVATYILE